MSRPALIADENIAAPLISALREAGWDVHFIAESSPGVGDDTVLQQACAQSRILITEDRDFGELVFRMRKDIPGVILIRLPTAPWRERWARLRSVLDQHSERFQGSFTVIQQNKVRFRPIVSS